MLRHFLVLRQALRWIAERSTKQVRMERDEILDSLEWADTLMRDSGVCEASCL